MILNTELELVVVINEVETFYNGKLEDILMFYIKSEYEKKCYQNQYINKVISISKHSIPEVINKNLSANIRVYVVALVEVIKYDELDIITNLKVSQIISKDKIGNQIMIECKNDHCIALMRVEIEALHNVNVGDIISIKVGQVSYKIKRPNILVSAYPFVVGNITPTIFNISKLEDNDKAYLVNSIIPIYKTLLERKHELLKDKQAKDRFDYFTKLLYPFKTDKSKSIKSNEVGDLLELDTDGYVSICNELPLTDMKIKKIKSPDSNAVVVNEHAINVYQKLLFKAYNELDAIINMTKIYKDTAVFDKHQYYFDIYADSKLK